MLDSDFSVTVFLARLANNTAPECLGCMVRLGVRRFLFLSESDHVSKQPPAG